MRLIEENRERCGERDRCVIIRDTVEHALDGPLPGGPFDLIVLDPPYDFADMEQALTGAAAQRAPGACSFSSTRHASRRRSLPVSPSSAPCDPATAALTFYR